MKITDQRIRNQSYRNQRTQRKPRAQGFHILKLRQKSQKSRNQLAKRGFMARITLEAATKDVKNSKTGELVYVAGQTRVKIFNDSISDGMNLDSFEAVVEEEGNWVMINSGFSIDGKVVPAREAMYSPGEILVKPNHGDERRYQLKDDAIKAFAAVAKHTRINNRDLELRKQNAAA